MGLGGEVAAARCITSLGVRLGLVPPTSQSGVGCWRLGVWRRLSPCLQPVLGNMKPWEAYRSTGVANRLTRVCMWHGGVFWPARVVPAEDTST